MGSIKIIEKKGNLLKFEAKDINPAFANMIRRIILNRVPSLSIEKVDIINNTSALYDEILAHRLGLIPLKFDRNQYVKKEECKCGGAGCEKCQVKFVIKKAGPCNVYAKDMKSTDPDVKVVDPNILIAKLLKNQEIDIELTAQLGTGAIHSKWTSAIVGYKYFPTLKISKDCDECKKCIKACPKGLIGKDYKLTDPYECDLDCVCEEECPKHGLIIKGDETHIIFTVESISGLDPEEIVLSALETAKSLINEVKVQVKES